MYACRNIQTERCKITRGSVSASSYFLSEWWLDHVSLVNITPLSKTNNVEYFNSVVRNSAQTNIKQIFFIQIIIFK